MNVEEMERHFFELKGKLDVGAVTEAEFKTEIEKLKFQDQQGNWWMIGAQSGKWYTFDGVRWLPGKPPVEEPPQPTQPAAPPATVPAVPLPPAPQSTMAAEPAPASASGAQTAAPVVTQATHETDQVAENEAPPPAPQITREVEPAVQTPSIDLPPPPTASPAMPDRLQPSPSAPVMPEHLQTAPRLSTPPPPPLELERLRSAHMRPHMPIAGPAIIITAAVFAIVAVACMWIAVDNFVPGKPISSFFAGLTGSKIAASTTPTSAGGQTIASKDVTPLVAMGDRLLMQSNVDSAITQYQSAAQLAPSSPIPLTHWSRALAFKGQMVDALDKAQQAVQRGPTDADANAQLCRALVWNGQVNDAMVAGEKAVQLDPKNASAHACLAEVYLTAQRLSDAQSQAQTAMQLAPQSAESYRARALVLTIQGDKNAALDAWRQAAALEPDFYFRHFELGEALRVYFNSSADAVPEYQKSVGLYGAYVPAISRLGIALIEAKQPRDATMPLERAITLDPKNAEAYAYLGVAFGDENDCAQAIPYFEQALKLDPNSSLAQQGLADCKSDKAPSAPTPVPPQVPVPPPTLVPSR
jgi:tetratricopeptide (TPR) repeat protein